VYCHEIRSLPEGVPDLFDAEERERYFEPQVLIAGEPGQQFEVGMKVENGGTGDAADTVYVEIYASPDDVITGSDYYIGRINCWISAGGSVNAWRKMTFPTDIPPGLYYIGWIVDPDDLTPDEYDEDNNVAYLASYRLTVLGPPDDSSLTISAATGGRITAPGEGVFVYGEPTKVSVEAAADPNCAFLGWTGTAAAAGKVADASAPQTNVTVDAMETLQAVFDGPHLLLEDFESYKDPENPLTRLWIDGLGSVWGDPQGHKGNDTGSDIGRAEAPAPGNPTIHGGKEAMFFSYRNNERPWYSEAERRWGELQNWSATGASALSLWYRGAASNDAESLYMAVEDAYGVVGVATHPDPLAVRKSEWGNWKVPLAQFEDDGVLLSRVVKTYLGVGDRNDPKRGGEGTLYFDDITLVHENIDKP
jgi:hypothetical protein